MKLVDDLNNAQSINLYVKQPIDELIEKVDRNIRRLIEDSLNNDWDTLTTCQEIGVAIALKTNLLKIKNNDFK